MPAEDSTISYKTELRSGRDFAARKTKWHLQVAADRQLPRSALMVALVLPLWLNAKSEEAFPAQSTIASKINLTTRAVQKGIQTLVDRGHLLRKSGKRGYRGTNIYKMELHNTELVNDGSSSMELEPEMTNGGSLRRRIAETEDDERPFRQTMERTKERTSSGEQSFAGRPAQFVELGSSEQLDWDRFCAEMGLPELSQQFKATRWQLKEGFWAPSRWPNQIDQSEKENDYSELLGLNPPLQQERRY